MDSSEDIVREEDTQPETTQGQSTSKRKKVSARSKLSKSKKKTRATRSPVWEDFSRLEDDYDRCICNHCGTEFGCATTNGTSHLAKHLTTCTDFKAWKDSEVPNAKVISKDGGLMNAKVSEAVFREATNELVVLAELPLCFTESLGWRHFCRKVNLYKPHSRRTATRDIVMIYVKRKAEMKQWIAATKQRVSLTTDIWVSPTTGASYMVVTVHFIDANWQIRKLIIGFKYVMDHKGQTICNVLLECLAEWGIEKVFTITVDNATANTSALKKFHTEFSSKFGPDAFVLAGDYLHMRCAAHILNLIVREGLQEIGNSVAVIRNAVQYVRASTNRLNSFEQKVDSGKISRGSLPLDVKTRWNSTYLMLKKALKFKLAFDKMEYEDKLYNDYFNEVDNGKKRIGPPTSQDWNAVERLVRFLIVFYHSTLVVSSSTSVNSVNCFGEIVTIENTLNDLKSSLDRELSTKADEMLAKFDKYWGGMRFINKVLVIASVFDPCKKMQFAKMCFDRIYGKDSPTSKQMYQSVFDVLGDMFEEYNSRYKKPVTLPSSQNSQTNHASSSNGAEDRMELVDDDFSYERMDSVYKQLVGEIGVADARDELDIYLKEKIENPNLIMGLEFDILSWWKVNNSKYPILSEIAKDVLAMQVSSVASESAFSTSGRILDPYRSCLTHHTLEVLMCTEQWLKCELNLSDKSVVTITQMLADIELQDELQKEFETKINLS